MKSDLALQKKKNKSIEFSFCMFDGHQLSISQQQLAEIQILFTCSSKILSDRNCDGLSAHACRQSSRFQRVGGNSHSS